MRPRAHQSEDHNRHRRKADADGNDRQHVLRRITQYVTPETA